jgi:membrane protease YdiL (CAAX protease family)
MDNMVTLLQRFLHPGLFMLIVIGAYFFIYSFRKNVGYPWGFGLVLAGGLLNGNGFIFQDNGVTVFWISASFLICLLGLTCNIVDIQNQVYIKDVRKVGFFSSVGLLLGVILMPFFAADQGIDSIQSIAKYTPFALLIGMMQLSVAEEFLFRGYLLSYLRKYAFSSHIAILFQALIFTVFHTRRYSDDWILLLVTFLFGFLAGYLTWKSDSLIPASLMHISINLFAVISGLLLNPHG